MERDQRLEDLMQLLDDLSARIMEFSDKYQDDEHAQAIAARLSTPVVAVLLAIMSL